MRVSIEKLPSNTTAKEHFRDWNAKPPSRGFNEPPSYAGDGMRKFYLDIKKRNLINFNFLALFPTKERNFVTSTSSVHQPIPVPKKTKLNAGVEMKGSIRLEGLFGFILVLLFNSI